MQSKAKWDVWGTWASALCAVHCVLTGLALGLLSVAGLGFLGSPVAEAAFILTAVALGSVAVFHGIRRHHSVMPAAIFVLGLGCILSSHLLFEHDNPMGTVMSVLGGLSLVAFHLLNLRLQKGCTCNSCEHTRETAQKSPSPN